MGWGYGGGRAEGASIVAAADHGSGAVGADGVESEREQEEECQQHAAGAVAIAEQGHFDAYLELRDCATNFDGTEEVGSVERQCFKGIAVVEQIER